MAPTLVKRYGKGTDSDATDTLVAHSLTSEGHDASEDGSGRGTPIVSAFAWQQGDDSKFNDSGRGRSWITRAGDYTGALGKSRYDAVAGETVGVRRLTPVEAERLQALPDDWTRLDDRTPDSRRYSALGDAVTASVAEWIGGRLLFVHEREPETAA